MNFLDMASIRLAVGLVLLIAANIALGSINAIIACEWDLVKFRNGCIKGGVIALALIAVYFAGYLNPDLMVVEVSGQTVNLMTAVSLVMLAAFTAYAVDGQAERYAADRNARHRSDTGRAAGGKD